MTKACATENGYWIENL